MPRAQVDRRADAPGLPYNYGQKGMHALPRGGKGTDMKTRLAVTAFATALMLAGSAMAGSRPDSRTMSCGQVQSLIAAQGSVVLTTGQYTYDRYVQDRFQCFTSAEVAVRTYVPTTDDKTCLVYHCKTVDPVDRRGLIYR